MTVASYKPPTNFRPSPKHLAVEGFTISGAVGVLAESPADPAAFPITVIVNGSARTRVTVSPAPGEYRILQQTVQGFGAEFLPVLEFNPTDEGFSGFCDYYGVGTVITSQFFTALISFLTPLIGFDAPDLLPSPTTDQTMRGRPGDVAFMTDGSGYFSDGVTWNSFAPAGVLKGKLTLGQAVAIALDGGYLGPSYADSLPTLSMAHAFAQDAQWDAWGLWSGVAFVASALGLTTDALAADTGTLALAKAMALTLDAVAGFSDSFSQASSLALTLDGSWSPPQGAPNYVASGAMAGVDGAGGTVSVPIPAGIQNNDILILIVSGYWTTYTFSGWTKFTPASQAVQMFWKRTTGTESPISLSGGTDVGVTLGQIHAFRGCTVTGSPIDAAWVNPKSNGAYSITTTLLNSLVVLYVLSSALGNVGVTAPPLPSNVTGAATTLVNSTRTGAISQDSFGYNYEADCLALLTGVIGAPGATGQSSYTGTGGFGYLFALKPLP